ncbi:hypothetical protein K438DRAFT_1572521 [Mycena galopus ATCC 62051]|nr:hypothetical protein K438DRAFT_1572521 [Mycena galopus ATCC 62051]
MDTRKEERRKKGTTYLCRHCGIGFQAQGITRHESGCEARQAREARNMAFAQELGQREHSDSDAPPSTEPLIAKPNLNDIKRVFHPHSQRPEILQSLDEYRNSQVPPDRRPPADEEPWLPFRTRLDFEVADFSQDARLNKRQTTALISLIRRCAENIGEFTIRTHSDLEKQWGAASKKCTEFASSDVTVPYGSVEQTFEMHARPLWDWTLDLIQDHRLSDFFVWDAEEAYFYNGTKYTRFYMEPWTAKAMWEIQSKLPNSPEHKLCPYILYADKSKLSSFGTQKGYPVIARLANIVVSLRNSTDWGGGQIVGWLPVVEEDPAQSHKTRYVNFKNAVWHKAFYELLESITTISKTGAWTKCGDGQTRCLYPMILILACDYEEACVMALIRGLKSNYPCPICMIKREEQSDTTKIAPLRTSHGSREIVERGRRLKADGREELLKSHGLRNVDNVFWEVAYSDPHQALSFEHLHSYSSGLWGHHLFERIKIHAKQISERTGSLIDAEFASFPRWRNLTHYDAVTGISFNDGSKHEDISKMIILTSHNVLVSDVDVLLLQLCRSYQELSLYITMRMQSEDRIADGRKEYQNFGRLLKVACANIEGLSGKNWNVPKAHGHAHAFDDIERKGVSRNFGAKIDEAMHGATRQAYLHQTNFKNVAPQILKSEHRTLICKYIRDQLDDLDDLKQCEWDAVKAAVEEEAEGDAPRDTGPQQDNVSLGSKQPPISFRQLEIDMQADPAFDRFRIKLGRFLTDFLPTYGLHLPGGKAVNFGPGDEIVPYRFCKIFYQSLDDWADETDYVRCSPSFHRHPRFDAAMVLTPTGTIFVRLICMFQVAVGETTHPFALIQPMDAPVGRILAKDKDLKLFRVRAKPRKDAEFIPVRSIIRGAVLVPDSARSGDYIVMDVLDWDMFLRLRDMYRARFG